MMFLLVKIFMTHVSRNVLLIPQTIVCFLGHLNSKRTSRPLPAIQHYKGCLNIDSTGNYEWFFTSLRERTLRPCFPGSLNYGMFAFLKIKLLLGWSR